MAGQRFVSGKSSPTARRYRWVAVWLSCACAVALLLLVNAVRDYTTVSRILATQQVRHQITQMSALIEQEIRRNGVTPDILQKALPANSRDAESINLRSNEGTLLEHAGSEFPPNVFSIDDEHAAFARRQPLSRTVTTSRGDVLVEAIPVRVPPRPGTTVAPTPTGPPRPMVLEIAVSLKDADAAVLTVIRFNLAINCAAALSLIATVVLSWIGLRSYGRAIRFEEQIEIAGQVQARLLPQPEVQIPGIDIATEYKPSEQVGGDFYDFFSVAPDGVACLIGDVSGKGIPAALLMGVIHGAVRSAPWHSSSAAHQAESRRLNELLCDRASGNRFASMFWCVYDPASRSLRYVNAGHCPPYLIGTRNGQQVALRLENGGPVLGLLPGAQYEATTVEALPGDLLVMYSDGLVEANNAAHEEFGEQRLSTLLTAHAASAPAQLREEILRSLAAFTSDDVPQDDLTFAVIRF